MRGPAGISRKDGMVKKDWTQGSLVINLLTMSWPVFITTFINTLGPTIDMIWVGKLGSDSIAGVGVSGLAVQVINSLVMGTFVGTSAMVARFIGARDETMANRVAQQAFVLSAGFSLVVAIIGIFLSSQIMALLGVSPEVVAAGVSYMRIQFIGIFTMSSLYVAQSVMQASGDMITPMIIGVAYRLLQIVLCPAMIFGWWIFPEMGVQGAALSNVIAQGFGGGFACWALIVGLSRIKVTMKNFKFDVNLIWRQVKIGIPAMITMAERNFAGLIMVGFIIPFGTAAVAAHSLAQRVDAFAQMLPSALSNPAGVLAAQNLGAKQPDRSARTVWIAAGVAVFLGFVAAIFVWVFSEQIARIFTSEPNLVAMTAKFLKIQVSVYLAWGLVVTMTTALNALGDTLVTMIANLVTAWGVQISLAYYLPHVGGLGVLGIRWAMAAAVIGRGIILPLYFKTGRWKNKKI
jgi:putative MATE family efflux protein